MAFHMWFLMVFGSIRAAMPRFHGPTELLGGALPEGELIELDVVVGEEFREAGAPGFA